MGRIKWNYISLILLLVLIVIASIRIKTVNEDRHYYETYRKNVQAGDTVSLGNLELTFGEASPPQIKKSESFANEKNAIYNLPIKITKKNSKSVETKDKFGIYIKYKDYKNLANISSDKKNNQDIISSINGLEKGEFVNLNVSTDFILGDFYYYYDDYNVEKSAYIVIAGPHSPKGIPLYYYQLRQES